MDQADLPAFMLEQLAGSYPQGIARRIRDGLYEAAGRPVTLRANALKATRADIAAALDAAGIAHHGLSWYTDAFVLDEARERAVWDLDAYKAGELYLQSLSAMVPALVLEPRAGADILDMCAAPGGKTSQMAALAGAGAHITACEMSAPRAEKLSYNLDKLGAGNVNVMRVDARRLDEFFSFDQIMLDAPCTGTGTTHAGDDRAQKRITPKLLAKVTRSQAALLDRALTVLKPGGTLVYSTCSVLPAENEEQVMRALTRHRDCELVHIDADFGPDGPALVENGLAGTLTICPSRDYEGFFIAKIKKSSKPM